jgi:hypothetical protein
MARSVLATVAVACSLSLVLACGGAVQEDPSSKGSGGEKTPFSATGTTPAGLSPIGSWDLVILESASGTKSTTTHGHFAMELRGDGKAVARRCTKLQYEPGLVTMRCADSQSYDCVYGSVKQEGNTWRVEFPDLRAPSFAEQGEIVPEGANEIIVRYVLPQYSAGHFIRVEDAPTAACKGP